MVSQPILQVMVGLGCRGGCVDAGQWEGAAAEALHPSPVPKATQGRIAQARGSPDRGQTSVPSPGQAALDTAGSRLASPNLSWGCASQGGVVHRGTEARWERPPRLGQDNHQRLDRPPVPPSSQRWDRPPVCLYRHRVGSVTCQIWSLTVSTSLHPTPMSPPPHPVCHVRPQPTEPLLLSCDRQRICTQGAHTHDLILVPALAQPCFRIYLSGALLIWPLWNIPEHAPPWQCPLQGLPFPSLLHAFLSRHLVSGRGTAGWAPGPPMPRLPPAPGLALGPQWFLGGSSPHIHSEPSASKFC